MTAKPTMSEMHDFGDGRGPVKAHRHINGGGWVEDNCRVDPDCYVSEDSTVTDWSWVIGGSKVTGGSTVIGRLTWDLLEEER